MGEERKGAFLKEGWYPKIWVFFQGRENWWVLLERSTMWLLRCFLGACFLLPTLPGSLGSGGNQWTPAAILSRSITGSSPWTSSSQAAGEPGKLWPQLPGPWAKELWTPVLMQTNSQRAGKSSGNVHKNPDDYETWGFAFQPAKKVVSRWAGRRPGSWGW